MNAASLCNQCARRTMPNKSQLVGMCQMATLVEVSCIRAMNTQQVLSIFLLTGVLSSVCVWIRCI